MRSMCRDTATQFPAMIVYTVDGSSEAYDLDPIVFMRDDTREDDFYDGLLIEAKLNSGTRDGAHL